MFRRVFIANRGEVAARVARTCRRLGIRTAAGVSDADVDAGWHADIDQVVRIGGARPADSYLDADALIEAALRARATAVHPGWGFLSENARFAVRVEAAGLTFVGPTGASMRRMGDKAEARRTLRALGLPLIPGSADPVADERQAERVADEVGYPVLLKAVAGGGGRGMRVVFERAALAGAFAEASGEARSAFGDGRLYVEKRLEGCAHVEVQVLGDGLGRAIHLGERECSLQRRHQKVLEESPSPGLSEAERERVLPRVAEAVGRARYRNAGTVEMLRAADGCLFFMEMNTRLQVEHAVTEEVTGVDLVEWQLRVAANEPLPASPPRRGHAIEVRINAEDPDDGFRPCPGTVSALRLPSGDGIRVDTGLRSGDRITPHYDSMVMKLIASGPDRRTALSRLSGALDATEVVGVRTNLGLHRRIVRWDAFRAGTVDTGSLERWLGGVE
jgi:acetyl/propionyl-CoA carboxylase alpha subunit